MDGGDSKKVAETGDPGGGSNKALVVWRAVYVRMLQTENVNLRKFQRERARIGISFHSPASGETSLLGKRTTTTTTAATAAAAATEFEVRVARA